MLTHILNLNSFKGFLLDIGNSHIMYSLVHNLMSLFNLLKLTWIFLNLNFQHVLWCFV